MAWKDHKAKNLVVSVCCGIINQRKQDYKNEKTKVSQWCLIITVGCGLKSMFCSLIINGYKFEILLFDASDDERLLAILSFCVIE